MTHVRVVMRRVTSTWALLLLWGGTWHTVLTEEQGRRLALRSCSGPGCLVDRTHDLSVQARPAQRTPFRCSKLADVFMCTSQAQPAQVALDSVVSCSEGRAFPERRRAAQSFPAVSSWNSHVSCLERSHQGQSTALVECCDEG